VRNFAQFKIGQTIFPDGQLTFQLFSPPVKDFAVVKVTVPAGVERYAIENRAFGSILIVLDGAANATAGGDSLQLKEGSILFIAAEVKNLGLKITSANGFVAYQAMYNDF
jgi:mannose-6-phosphate isomerase